MEIILSDKVKSVTGRLEHTTGYVIRRRGKRFFAMRKPKGDVPHNGHIRFIRICAQTAANGVYFSDISVPAAEFRQALDEAGMLSWWYTYLSLIDQKHTKMRLNAQQVNKLFNNQNL